MLDLRYVKKLVEMLDESTVDAIEISSEKGMKIRISKTPVSRGVTHVSAPIMHAAPTVATPVISHIAPVVAHAAGGAAKEEASSLIDVKSPMVGTFYSRPEPSAAPFVQVGSKVTKGQVLCIIEAMKIMNEIESEVSGTVREICVTDAHPVEFGQPLFRIDPNG